MKHTRQQIEECPFCMLRQGCMIHDLEYEPEIHGPNGSIALRRERTRELEQQAELENKGDEARRLYELKNR